MKVAAGGEVDPSVMYCFPITVPLTAVIGLFAAKLGPSLLIPAIGATDPDHQNSTKCLNMLQFHASNNRRHGRIVWKP